MGGLVWAGTVAALAGVGGILWCIREVLRARAAGLDPERFRVRMQRVVAVNMAALGVSALGLAMVVSGLMLG